MRPAFGDLPAVDDEDLVRRRTVESRWAIASDVRPASAVASARWIATSDSESRCAVASSSTTTDGALSSNRARARRCFSPPDKR